MTWAQAERWVSRGWAVLVELTVDHLVIESRPWVDDRGRTQGPIRFTIHKGP